MVYSYKYTLARRAIVATLDLSAENLDLFESDLLLFEKKEVCSYQDRTCLFGETRKRFSCEEKKGLVCGRGRRFVLVQKRACLFGGTRRRGLCVQKRQDVGKESNPKVGKPPGFGSDPDYNAGLASAHTWTTATTSRIKTT